MTGADRNWDRVSIVAVLVAAGLQLWLWSRGWFYGDQWSLYQAGLSLALEGELLPFAKHSSGGGVIPGCLLQSLVGLPLVAWLDHRASTLFSCLLQLGALLLLVATLRRVLGARFAALFAIVYGLAPWRLYHSGFIWEPVYLMLPAALHLWATVRSRRERSLVPSLVLGWIAVAAIQLHPSGIVLPLVTSALVVVRIQRIHLPAAALGAGAGALTLIPTLRAWLAGAMPAVAPGGGWEELGLVRIFPIFKALGYWFRLPSLDVGRRLEQASAGNGVFLAIAAAIGVLSVIAVVAANVTAARTSTREVDDGRRRFVLRYAAVTLAASLLAIAISTITPQSWHLLVALHAGAIPVALGCELALERKGVAVAAVALFLVLRFPLIVALGLGHPMYVVPLDDPNRALEEEGRFAQIVPRPAPFGTYQAVTPDGEARGASGP